MIKDIVETNSDLRRHELLADVAEQVAKTLLEKHNLAQDMAIDIGNDIADFLSEHWKGQNIYMNADTQFKLSKRDLVIFERMGRGKAHEIGKEFGISFIRVYQIYRRCLTAARRRNQPSLFADPEPAAVEELSTADNGQS